MRRFRSGPFLAAATMLGALSCSSSPGGESVSPITLDIPRSQLPSPGLCRVRGSGQQTLQQGCDGIENLAPLGSQILYRPDDGSRTVHVCHMSTSVRALIVGIDVFNIDNRRHIRVLQRYGEEVPGRTCAGG